LGSLRIHLRFNPSSNATTFSDQARHSRNNTEAFIKKLCNDEKSYAYVRKLVRCDEKLQRKSQFRVAHMKHIREKARAARVKKVAQQEKKQNEMARLKSVGFISDEAAVRGMTISQLKDQIRLYKNHIVRDEVLEKTTMKSLANRAAMLEAVIGALGRRKPWYVS
jgi:hypothetical protein